MIHFQRGTVRRVLAEKGYGFLAFPEGHPLAGRDVYFLLKDGGGISVETEGNGFAAYPVHRECDVPKVGDLLAFVLCTTDRGPKARPWAFASELDVALATIAASPMYRVICAKRFCGKVVQRDATESVLWAGTNVAELIRKYPCGDGADGDTLANHTRRSHELVYRFEVKTEAGWTACDDPRRLTVEKAA